mmetsp:Transcript_56126/g.111540  ORF Transcript_56126/g.111540 Transcript_56126/m.111540 type:complete len:411 (+) Transcript_56126:54-1286(+)
MGAKRVAGSQSPKRRTKQKKGAKVQESATPEHRSPPVATLPDWCMPALGLLETPVAAAELPVSCRDMVAAMLPKSGLNSEAGGRHLYQRQFLEGLSEHFTGLQTGHQAAIAMAQDSIAALASEQTEVVSKVGVTKQRADEMRAVRDAKHETWKKAVDAVAETGKAITTAQEQVKNHEAEHKCSQDLVEQLGQFMATKFVPLKEFSIPGNQWRLRAKTSKEVANTLASILPVGVEDSLRDALQVAFKRKPGENESFAVMTIEYAEKLFSKHLASLDAKINSFDTTAQAGIAAVTAAEEAAVEAKKHKDDAESEYMAADNQLLEADTLADDAANEENQLKPRAAELAAALEKAEAELAQVQSFIANFEALREGLPAASAAEVTAGEEVTDQSTATEATAREEATAQSTGGER